MEYTIRTKAEFNAETHRHVFGDFSWMSDIEPSLFLDKEVAGKILRWANADDGSDRYLVKYFPKEYWQRRDCILVTDRLSCPRIALPSCPPTAQLTVRGRACFAGRVNLPVFLSNTPDNH